MSRAREIWECLSYGVRPWWIYEDEPHHDLGYWRHLRLNLQEAGRLLQCSDFSASDESPKSEPVQEVWFCEACGEATGVQWSENATCAGSIVMGDAHTPQPMVRRRLA